jgi:hypothetical protein
LLQIAYVNRQLCILSNAKRKFPEKFSFYLILRIDDVKTCKNWFLRQFLEFEVPVCPDTAYSECAELYLGAEE